MRALGGIYNAEENIRINMEVINDLKLDLKWLVMLPLDFCNQLSVM